MFKTKIIFSDRRMNFPIFVMLFLVLLMIFKLIKIQIIDHSKYTALAREEHIKSLIIPSKRGKIYISNGNEISPLVLNNEVFDVYIDPKAISDKNNKKVIKMLRRNISNKLLKDYKEKFKKNNTRYQIVAKNLTEFEAQKIKDENYLGVGLSRRNVRYYPEGKLASQVIGFVNAEGKGQYGIEQKLDKKLKGEDGYLKTITDVSKIPLTIGNDIVKKKPKNGENIVLTIDRNIQFQAERVLKAHLKKLEAKEGSMLIINPQNGHVLAMANYPDYNPAEREKVKDMTVFSNFTTMSPYEAGSVVKSFTTTMGVDTDTIKPMDTYDNKDCVMVYDRKICNVMRGMNGPTTFQDALRNSLNTGMIEILRRMGNGKIDKNSRKIMYDYFNNKFRFGYPTKIELPERISGLISPDEIEGNAVRYSNMTFGQGFSLTMMQAVSAYSSVINGGIYYQPTVIKGIYKNGKMTFKKPKVVDNNVVSKNTSAISKEMFRFSRGRLKLQDIKGFAVGGKTGTSETIVDGKYDKSRTVASYLGYGGTQKEPKYVIMVRVAESEIGLHGWDHAAPVFNEMSNWMINYLKLQPKE